MIKKDPIEIISIINLLTPAVKGVDKELGEDMGDPEGDDPEGDDPEGDEPEGDDDGDDDDGGDNTGGDTGGAQNGFPVWRVPSSQGLTGAVGGVITTIVGAVGVQYKHVESLQFETYSGQNVL